MAKRSSMIGNMTRAVTGAAEAAAEMVLETIEAPFILNKPVRPARKTATKRSPGSAKRSTRKSNARSTTAKKRSVKRPTSATKRSKKASRSRGAASRKK
jgi:hypothetical protein